MPIPNSAQTLSIGVIGGFSPTDAFRDRTFVSLPNGSPRASRFFSESKDYLIGGVLEMRFSPKWALEVNGIFRQLHMTHAGVLPNGSMNSVSPAPVVTWQFPLLAKYRFAGRKVSPFVVAGPSFRTAGNLNGTDPSHTGATAGIGFETSWRSVKIAPSVRYTRWATDKDLPNRVTSAPNQLEFVVAFSRETESIRSPAGKRISVGALMGTNLTGDFRNRFQNIGGPPGSPIAVASGPGSHSFIAGAMVELQLHDRFALEIDAIHRPLSATSEAIHADGARRKSSYRSVTWQFPILAKYRFNVGPLRPFIGAGPSFRLKQQALTFSSPYGITTAAGVEFHLRHLKISPSVRFSRWGPDRFVQDTTRNQAELLVGFSF